MTRLELYRPVYDLRTSKGGIQEVSGPVYETREEAEGEMKWKNSCWTFKRVDVVQGYRFENGDKIAAGHEITSYDGTFDHVIGERFVSGTMEVSGMNAWLRGPDGLQICCVSPIGAFDARNSVLTNIQFL